MAQQQPHRPTLFIGLGGTGKQILLNLRKLLHERFGEATLPHLAHLWIDTDPRNVTIDGQELDFLMREVDFRAHEALDVELRRADVLNYYKHKDDYPHIFSWLDQRTEKLPPIENGAGAVRCVGRLAFFHHFNAIRQRLIEKKEDLDQATARQQARDQYDTQVESGSLEVWLLYSVAGGTGSGMFLDMAFLIREMWPNVKIRAMIVLPTVFSSDHSNRIFANSYASLMELEHYSFDKSSDPETSALYSYPATWTKAAFQSGAPRIKGPVFDMAYLIDNRTSSGGVISIDRKDALCKMLAERLYLEHASGDEAQILGGEFRSFASNFATSLIQQIVKRYEKEGFEERFSCRFGSLGLSKLYIPIRPIHIASEYRLARDLIEFWTRERRVAPNLDPLIDKLYLKEIGVDNERNKDFVRALEPGPDNERLPDRLRKMIWNKRGRLLAGAGNVSIYSEIDQWCENELFDEQLRGGGLTRERKGAMSRILEQNADACYRQVVRNLDQFVADRLAEPEHRFETAREALRRIVNRLKKDHERFAAIGEKSRANANRYLKETRLRMEWLHDVKGNFTRQKLVEVIVDFVDQRAQAELRAQTAELAAQLALRIAETIGQGEIGESAQGEKIQIDTGLIKKLVDHQKRLRNLIPELERRYESYARFDSSPIHQDLSDGVKEIERHYVDKDGRPITESTLVDWEQRFFEEQEEGDAHNLWDLRNMLESRGVPFMIRALVKFSRESLHYLETQSNADVLAALAEKYRPETPEYARVMDHLLTYSEPWLGGTPSHHVEHEQIGKIQRKVFLIARKESQSPAQAAFDHYIDTRIPGKVNRVSTTLDRVYATQTLAGVALMSIADLDRYRNSAYYPAIKQGDFVHTDLAFEKFQDLLSKTPQEAEQMIQVLKSFLEAVVIGTITADYDELAGKSGALLNYRFTDTSGLYSKTIDLGPFSVALQVLLRAESEKLLRDVRAQTRKVRDQMTDRRERQYYALLRFHSDDPRSFFHRFPEQGAERKTLNKLALGIVPDGDEKAIAAARIELDNIEQWTLEQPLGSGLRILGQ